MDEYAGRVLAERYRLPLRPSGEEYFAETRAFDTYSGQEVLLRQVPLPEVVEAEVVGDPGFPGGGYAGGPGPATADRSPRDPAVRRALEAVTAAAQIPDHPLLDQVFDVFAQDGSLWIVGELIPARPLSALLAERPLSPHRAAEIAADVLTALRALHAHGRLHRNITARTVLVCDDGRAILTGLAVGAAQEALCGYDLAPGEGAVVPEQPVPDASAAARAEPARVSGARQEESPGARFSPYGDHVGVPTDLPGNGDTDLPGGTDADPHADAHTGIGADTGELPAPRREPAPESAPEPQVRLTKSPTTTPAASASPYGRPSAALAAERAWQARLQIVGPVTERWAPEQAEPPEHTGELMARTVPATDLWAVGVLLFRAVQGHPPFPEESAAELAHLVRSQPPAPAGECGEDLGPLIAALLSQDPAGRPDFEELRGRLRALIRTAPEPEIGRRLVTIPALEQGSDPRRLPILRRRGELVRKERRKKGRARRERRPQAVPLAAPLSAEAAPRVAPVPRPARPPRPPKQPKPFRQPRPARPVRSFGPSAGDPYEEQQLLVRVGLEAAPKQPRRAARDDDDARAPRGRGPRHLGRLLLALILLLLVGAVAYAMVFLPKSGEEAQGGPGGSDGTGVSGAVSGGSPAPPTGQDSGQDQGRTEGQDGGGSGGSQAPQPTPPANVAPGYALRTDPEGFQVAVHKGWQRRAKNSQGQVRYLGGDYELLIVPGRDTTAHFGADPMAYQQDKEGELAPYRGSGWSSASGLRRTDVGKTAMAEGTFTWKDSSGRAVYVRNLAMIHNGRYHLVVVIGPDNGRREVDRLYEQATSTYTPK
ncbi:protein kinase [Streptomyces sp. NPDC101227]|uniref:protein kinase n=1 Tax=Streptomyces sp. NPDC101227 TaxID=3366136 RepID=UPI003807FBA9